ncbi:hypothetical protein EXN22_07525 [Pseudomonas tructae]|uniref:Uncharacterized protein n=1 Tax=Pseudomonas tructae TaxID=2518644 RepID=A0A411MFH3_9PSED|nr:hypothetical protein [Pseudomonas tructae]QBF25556.1 hypothetical protein EXN22_07525 [Pseudomonas tructae]
MDKMVGTAAHSMRTIGLLPEPEARPVSLTSFFNDRDVIEFQAVQAELADDESTMGGARTKDVIFDSEEKLRQVDYKVKGGSLYRAHHSSENDVNERGVLRNTSGDDAESFDDYLVKLFQHTAGHGSHGAVMSFSSEATNAKGFLSDNKVLVEVAVDVSKPEFISVPQLILQHAGRLLSSGKLEKCTLLTAMDQLNNNEHEFFCIGKHEGYQWGEIPPLRSSTVNSDEKPNVIPGKTQSRHPSSVVSAVLMPGLPNPGNNVTWLLNTINDPSAWRDDRFAAVPSLISLAPLFHDSGSFVVITDAQGRLMSDPIDPLGQMICVDTLLRIPDGRTPIVLEFVNASDRENTGNRNHYNRLSPGSEGSFSFKSSETGIYLDRGQTRVVNIAPSGLCFTDALADGLNVSGQALRDDFVRALSSADRAVLEDAEARLGLASIPDTAPQASVVIGPDTTKNIVSAAPGSSLKPGVEAGSGQPEGLMAMLQSLDAQQPDVQFRALAQTKLLRRLLSSCLKQPSYCSRTEPSAPLAFALQRMSHLIANAPVGERAGMARGALESLFETSDTLAVAIARQHQHPAQEKAVLAMINLVNSCAWALPGEQGRIATLLGMTKKPGGLSRLLGRQTDTGVAFALNMRGNNGPGADARIKFDNLKVQLREAIKSPDFKIKLAPSITDPASLGLDWLESRTAEDRKPQVGVVISPIREAVTREHERKMRNARLDRESAQSLARFGHGLEEATEQRRQRKAQDAAVPSSEFLANVAADERRKAEQLQHNAQAAAFNMQSYERATLSRQAAQLEAHKRAIAAGPTNSQIDGIPTSALRAVAGQQHGRAISDSAFKRPLSTMVPASRQPNAGVGTLTQVQVTGPSPKHGSHHAFPVRGLDGKQQTLTAAGPISSPQFKPFTQGQLTFMQSVPPSTSLRKEPILAGMGSGATGVKATLVIAEGVGSFSAPRMSVTQSGGRVDEYRQTPLAVTARSAQVTPPSDR